jgi:hypothetical protein
MMQYEAQMRAEQAEALVQTMRAAPPQAQADALTRRLLDLDSAGRRAVYRQLHDDELELLVPGIWAYLNGLSTEALEAITTDPVATRNALWQIRRQQGG